METGTLRGGDRDRNFSWSRETEYLRGETEAELFPWRDGDRNPLWRDGRQKLFVWIWRQEPFVGEIETGTLRGGRKTEPLRGKTDGMNPSWEDVRQEPSMGKWVTGTLRGGPEAGTLHGGPGDRNVCMYVCIADLWGYHTGSVNHNQIKLKQLNFIWGTGVRNPSWGDG